MISITLSEGIQEHWFAAYTCSCREKRVAQKLSVHQIEHFLPLHRKFSRWKNGLQMRIEMPLFPGYVFVKIDCRDRVRVLELPGVHSIAGAGRLPIPLPYHEIEALRRGLNSLEAQPCPLSNSGRTVFIRKGPLEGMTGVVVRQKNTSRVIITLNLILRSISVEVDEQDLELIDHDTTTREFAPAFFAITRYSNSEKSPI
jgi:transcription antitermination factor NusG